MLEPESSSWNAIINHSLNGKHQHALSLFTSKLRCPFNYSKPDYRVLAHLLKSCSALSAIKLGRTFHSHAIKMGYLCCRLVSKGLLNMYAKCGALNECHVLFSELGHCTNDPVLWNIMLTGLASSGIHDADVVNLFREMCSRNVVRPSGVTAAVVLPVCARLRDLYVGKFVHSWMVKLGLESQTLVGNALLSMYAKCGVVETDAYAAFCGIDDKDVVSWNAMIAGFSENGRVDYAFELFQRMLKGLTLPNYATIVNVLPLCGFLAKDMAYWFGREIHSYVLRRCELAENVSVRNALLSFYLRIRLMKEAGWLFRTMQSRDLVSWNSIIAGYAANGEWSKALDLFYELVSGEMLRSDSVTILSILPACAHLHDFRTGKVIHGYVLKNSSLYQSTAVGNALINFYAKCHNMHAMYGTFSMIAAKDLISWNTMLDALAGLGCEIQFLNLFRAMLREGFTPDSISLLTIVHFYASLTKLGKVKEAHNYAAKAGLLQGCALPTLGSAILDAYAKCGKMGYAKNIFQSLSGTVTCNSLTSGYVDCGSVIDSSRFFSKISEADITNWNRLIQGYAENGFPDQAHSLFLELQARGKKPDAVTIMSILPVCSQLASVNMLRQCHGYVVRACFEDVQLHCSLIDVYSKCGNIHSAHKLFSASCQKDVVMFTSMIGGYAVHGMGEQALHSYSEMLELDMKPDHVIITSVLSACSHSGLVDEGRKIFNSIEEIHGIKPTMEQYACMVDILARRGKIKDAYAFITSMPVQPTANIWGTLLGACKTHNEVELGRIASNSLMEAESNDVGSYVVTSNLYAADARWDNVMEMRKVMKEKDLKKPAGCSWIELEGKRNTFIAGDYSHTERSLVYETLALLVQHLKKPFSLYSAD